MTVCVGVAVNDCLVFAADSASTLVSTNQATGVSEVLNVYQHGDKVFNLYKKLPICAMTCGMGNIGQASIGTLAKEFRRRMMNGDAKYKIDPKKYSIEEITNNIRKFLFDERFQVLKPAPPPPHSLEFWIGGYSSDFDSGHEIWKIAIINGNCDAPECILKGGGTGLFSGGQSSPVNRLVGGFDPVLHDELVATGADPAVAASLLIHLRGRMQASLLAPTMPVRDAIDLAEFLVEMTKRYFRFLPGADIVGGETDVAVVTKYEGFKWIRRKHFYSQALNPLETDHA